MRERYSDLLWTVLFLVLATDAAFSIVSMIRNRAETERIPRIEQRLAELIEQVDVIGSRVTFLERPREPVNLPRNPGRIGSTDSP